MGDFRYSDIVKVMAGEDDVLYQAIQYLKDNNAAIIATEYSQILDKLSTIIENPQIIDEYGRKAFECGQKNHDETKVREVFINTFIKAVEKNDF